MAKAEEKITQMYDAQLKNQKAQLQKDNDAANANLDKAQRENQKATDASLNRVAVEAQKDMMNDAEYYAASGLSSGARAQARLSRSNQQAADMTALRQAGLEADAEAERQRALLAKEYAAAITQAQAENDLKKAQALYEQAQLEEQRLLQKQLAEEETLQAQIKAQGDLAAQQAKLQQERELAAAKLLAESGDYSRLAQIYGLTDNEVAILSGETPKITPPPGKKPVNPLSGMTAIDFQAGANTGNDGSVYGNDASGRPIGLTGHGKLSPTGKTAVFKATTSSGKTASTEQPVMQAEDGSLWYWNPMQHRYVAFSVG